MWIAQTRRQAAATRVVERQSVEGMRRVGGPHHRLQPASMHLSCTYRTAHNTIWRVIMLPHTAGYPACGGDA
jgi:hypothetical protein